MERTQNDYVQALVNGESFCKELAQARNDEEAAKADLDKVKTDLPMPQIAILHKGAN